MVDSEELAARVRCAGSLFVGPWSAQVAGDYAIGSNHVLPTAGTARVRGGLSAADFVRQITVQRLSRAGLEAIGASVMALACAEGLTAHAESVAIRLRAPRGVTPVPPATRSRRDAPSPSRARTQTRKEPVQR